VCCLQCADFNDIALRPVEGVGGERLAALIEMASRLKLGGDVPTAWIQRKIVV
jgi:hypothetical protein